MQERLPTRLATAMPCHKSCNTALQMHQMHYQAQEQTTVHVHMVHWQPCSATPRQRTCMPGSVICQKHWPTAQSV